MAKIIAHYGEIGLKGKNRPIFENKLIRNIKAALGGQLKSARRLSGRILIEIKGDAAEAEEKLKNVFGIVYFSFAAECGTEMSEIKKSALAALKNQKAKIFKIETRRSYKKFPLNSLEVSRETGKYIEKNSDFLVNIKSPKVILRIEILKDRVFIYCRTASGAGGLPAGTAGRALVLISGGIDSPVAAYFLMKRGAAADFLHFHSYPYTDKASIEKVREIIKILGKFQPESKLFLAPIIDFQKEVMKKCDSRLRIVLYRRLMYKVAEEIAEKYGYSAIVSGDSLGQVASQTMENMNAVGNGIALPIFRPLIGFDKEEIIAIAKKIGTFSVSIEPHGDCCGVFQPKNPATKARLADVLREEKKVNMKKWAGKIVSSIMY